ncbi:MAG TPA: hypothetical protein VM580_17195 [Labilithrix sp.]|nr:hypothetical protein [Labilithrix sp.]
MRDRTTFTSRLGLALFLSVSSALAADGAPPSPAASDVRPDASAKGAASESSGGQPESAPAKGEGAAAEARTDGGAEPSENPHARGHGHADGGNLFEAPKDGVIDDPTLPVGTLDIQVVDPEGKPIPNVQVTLGVLYNSVAKGESRKRLSLASNASGVARVEHLETGSSVAYRPMIITEGATFSVMPFRMSETTGMRAMLHVYPVVEDIESAVVVSQSILYAEVKDDRIQVQQAFHVYNFGKSAWVPKNLIIPMPEEFTAFTSQQGMTDVGAEAVPKQGVRVHGTFGPGQHSIEFRWQLPYAGQPEVRFDVGMLPRMAATRVIAPASKGMTLEVPGFPPPQSTSDALGQRALITERQLRREDPPLTKMELIIRGLPSEGPAKLIATMLSGAGILVGIVLGTKKPGTRNRKGERDRLLEEIEELERAKLSGDVGPKTYEKARRDLLDALARTFADAPPVVAAKTRQRGA